MNSEHSKNAVMRSNYLDLNLDASGNYISHALPSGPVIDGRSFEGSLSILCSDHAFFNKLLDGYAIKRTALEQILRTSGASNALFASVRRLLKPLLSEYRRAASQNDGFVAVSDTSSAEVTLNISATRYLLQFRNTKRVQQVRKMLDMIRLVDTDARGKSAAWFTQTVKTLRMTLFREYSDEFESQSLWAPIIREPLDLASRIVGTGDAIQMLRQGYKTVPKQDLLCDALKLFLPRIVDGIGVPTPVGEMFKAWSVDSATAYAALTIGQRKELAPYLSVAGLKRINDRIAASNITLDYAAVRSVTVLDAALVLSRFIYGLSDTLPVSRLESGFLLPEAKYIIKEDSHA